MPMSADNLALVDVDEPQARVADVSGWLARYYQITSHNAIVYIFLFAYFLLFLVNMDAYD